MKGIMGLDRMRTRLMDFTALEKRGMHPTNSGISQWHVIQLRARKVRSMSEYVWVAGVTDPEGLQGEEGKMDASKLNIF